MPAAPARPVESAGTTGTQNVGLIRLMDAVQIDFEAIPARAERFLETYRPAVARVLAYDAKGYLFFRSDEDPDHFVHVSFWDNRADFELYWYSREMQEVRERLSGLHAQPVLPHWSTVVEQG